MSEVYTNMNINRAEVCGRITRDLELRVTPSGKNVLSFSVATNSKLGDKETTEFHNIVAWGKLADLIEKYCEKGDEIYIAGRLQTRKWDKDGNTQYRTEIIASEMQFGAKKKGASTKKKKSKDDEDEEDEFDTSSSETDENVGDIPF